MDKWADYLISKVLYNQNKDRIVNIIARNDNGDSVGEEIEMTRYTLTQHFENGKTFATINKNGKWDKLSNIQRVKTFYNDYISFNNSTSKDDLGNIPFNITRRKTFISYYHKDENEKRKEFENLTDDLIINKSVEQGDIDSDNSDEYNKQLIQKEYLKDTTVLIVLIGKKNQMQKACRLGNIWCIKLQNWEHLR